MPANHQFNPDPYAYGALEEISEEVVRWHPYGVVCGAYLLLPIDLCEYPYYRNRRPDKGAYLDAFFHTVNRESANTRLDRVAGPA